MPALDSTPNRRVRAEDPCADVAGHPSVRGQKPARLRAWLSNYEFRAYRKGNGRIVLHLRTMLMIRTRTSFSSFAYLKGIRGVLALPSGEKVELDEIGFSEQCSVPYDGETLAVDLWLSVLTDFTECRPCIGHLDLRCCFNFHGALMEARVKHDVAVRRIRRRGERTEGMRSGSRT